MIDDFTASHDGVVESHAVFEGAETHPDVADAVESASHVDSGHAVGVGYLAGYGAGYYMGGHHDHEAHGAVALESHVNAAESQHSVAEAERHHETAVESVDSGHLPHLEEVRVDAGGGASGAFVAPLTWLTEPGGLAVVGVSHTLKGEEVGDLIDLTLPDGSHHVAKLTTIRPADDLFVAEISAVDAAKITARYDVSQVLHPDVSVGERIEFRQLAAVHAEIPPLLRLGVVASQHGTDGVWMATGSDAGPGASGSPVYDSEHHLVGQVRGHDAALGANTVVDIGTVFQKLAQLPPKHHGGAE